MITSKKMSGKVEVPTEYHPVSKTRESRGCHSKQYVTYQTDIDSFKYSFLPRTLLDWNKLPRTVVEAESLVDFKRRLTSRHQ